LIRWHILTAVGNFIYKLAMEALEKARENAPPHHLGNGTDMVKCPRCYTYVSAENAIPTRVEGSALHFCSNECLEAYRRDHQDIDATAIGEGSSD